ncbi:DUF4232 domain-containing protein [Streptomyces sp. NPDC005925]|uniref:DUF4232 domain-containing protein n=1 Tax=Streptomyces sp. NPDC005925 TaxID=3157172 RepID=UPI003410544A
MSARTHRTRMLAAAALAAAVLTLTACDDGDGARVEGADRPAATAATASPSQPDKATKETGAAASADPEKPGKPEDHGNRRNDGNRGNDGDREDSGAGAAASAPCTSASTRMTATEVTRPLNHLLLTVTNTGSKNCDLVGHPAVRLGEAQAVPPAFEDSKPQAVVTLAPGESGYAGVLLAAADGSGSHGYTARTLSVFLGDDAGSAHPSLPAKGVYVDDSLTVTYWQATMADALAW